MTAVEIPRLVSYLVLIAVAIVLYIVAGSLPASRWEPLGAGAFPKLVLGVIAALAVIAAIGSVRTLMREKGGGTGIDVGRWIARHRLVFLLFIGLAAYLALMPYLGFALASFLFLIAAELMLAPPTWKAWALALLLAIVFSFGLNYLFAEVFNVFLPRGRLLG